MNSQASNAQSNLIVHVSAPVSPAQLQTLQRTVGCVTGVTRVVPSVRLDRLLMIDYDPVTVSARAILNRVQAQGHAAQLVGM